MRRSRLVGALSAIGALLIPLVAAGQTTTYHLHKENSSTLGLLQLQTTNVLHPPSVLVQSGDLKNHPPESGTLRTFDTQAGVPGLAGTIPSGTTITFTLWMKKTSAFGTVYPQASVGLNWPSGAQLCQATGIAGQTPPQAISTTLSPITISCQTSAAITMTATDRVYVVAGYYMSTGPGNKSMKVELDYEGTFDGNYDSRVVVPNPLPPSITSLNPTSAPVNWSVTIAGSNFNATQGSSTVKFNGTTATPTSWSAASIAAPVPAGATTGPVVVTVSGAASNGVTFTVIPPPAITSATPTAAHRGDPVTITGTNFLATQGSSTVTFNSTTATPTSWNDTTIVTTVPSTATTGPIVVTVSSQASNGLPFTVIIPGTIGGTITRATGGAALAGATIQAVYTGIIKATATSAANGTYSIPNLDPGAYDVRVHATGYSSEVRSNTVVAPETTTTVDVAMSQPGSINGKVTQADGVTPLVGAAVTLFLGGIEKGSASTNATGDYSVSGLHVGAYTVQAAFVGYRTKEQGATILENTNTTSDLALSPMPAGPVTYAYDELGRLVMVVDAAGDAATYTYDAVGNILSIGRIASGTVAITEFTPNSAPVGAVVTIYGTGFSTIPTQNTVTINGVPATVTSSTATQIVTSVPSGATGTGAIGVTAPGGSATTPPSFTVTTAAGAPSISNFTPTSATAGTALTINGANFDTVAANNRVTVNEVFASLGSVTATSIGTTAPGGATSGRIKVMTPNGSAVSTADLYIPPPGFAVADILFTSRMSFGELTVPIGTANRIGLVLFDGLAGRRVSLKVDNVTFASTVVKVLSPTGAELGSISAGSLGAFLDTMPLSLDATYTILVDPVGSSTGSLRLTLYDVPADISATIAADATPVTPAPTTVPGQDIVASFTIAAGKRISLNVTNVAIVNLTGCKADVSILDAAGQPITAIKTCMTTSGWFFDVTAPLAAGTYRIVVDPDRQQTGTVTLTLYDVPADVTGSLTINVGDVLFSNSIPGQNGNYTFGGTSGQQVTVRVTDMSSSFRVSPCVTVKLLRPDPANPANMIELTSLLSCSLSFDLPQQTLPATDTYTVRVDPGGALVGSLRVRVTSP